MTFWCRVDDPGLLSNTLRDTIAIVGVIGTVASIVGLVYALIQIRRTKTATEAVAEAYYQSRVEYRRFAVVNALRFLAEIKAYVTGQQWHSAAFKITDLSNEIQVLTSLLGDGTVSSDSRWTGTTKELRLWAETFERLASGKVKNLQASKWKVFTSNLDLLLHQEHGPLLKNRSVGD